MECKYKVGQMVKLGKKMYQVENVHFSKYANKFIICLKDYHLWFYENELDRRLYKNGRN